MAHPLRLSGLVVALFALTVLTVTSAGLWHTVTFAWITTGTKPPLVSGQTFRGALWFDLAVMGSLVCHEAGHLWAYHRHRIPVQGPYFVPFLPLSVTGTLGAFLRPQKPCETRHAMIEVGAMGPVCGFAWAALCAVVGVSWSSVVPPSATRLVRFGTPMIIHWLKPGSLVLHPLAAGAWIGCLVAFINLLPFEYFDGSMILRALWPKLGRMVSVGMFGFALFMCGGWNPKGMTWAFALGVAIVGVLVSGGLQADPRDMDTPLSLSSYAWSLAAAGVLYASWTSVS